MYYKLRYNSKTYLMSFEFVDKSKCFDYYIGDVQVTFVKVFNDVDVVIKSNMKGILDGNNIKLYGEVKLEYGLYLLMKFSFFDINVNYGDNETNAEDNLLSFLYKENTFGKLEMIIPEILLNELCKNSGYPSFKSSYLDDILSDNK